MDDMAPRAAIPNNKPQGNPDSKKDEKHEST
jgi:hypothetical protein